MLWARGFPALQGSQAWLVWSIGWGRKTAVGQQGEQLPDQLRDPQAVRWKKPDGLALERPEGEAQTQDGWLEKLLDRYRLRPQGSTASEVDSTKWKEAEVGSQFPVPAAG